MDGNFTREGVTADLEAMQRAGLGGFVFMEVDAGVPKGPMKFMSPEWQELFVHMVREAERLGLQVTLNAGPGWTGSGGPWVRPEQSMQHLVGASLDVVGPTNFFAVLPRPKRRPAFFGDSGLPPELERARDEFYKDEVVLAFPTPTGDERIDGIDERALYVRAPYSSMEGVKPFLSTAMQFTNAWPETVIDTRRVLNLTAQLRADGALEWEVPEGKWTILRMGRTSTGANTRPAPAAAIGLESDKFDSEALDAHFEAFVAPLLRRLEPRVKGMGWTSLHIDSWEMGAQNWTAGFRDEFRKRRGYDCVAYLPAMTGRVVGSREISERFLWDLRQTCQELVIANHAEHLKKLGAKHGLGLSIEPYDMNPCADLSLGGVADVPMCEFWLYGFDSTYSVFEAASIAHTVGRPIMAAEAFTSSEDERWLAYPASVKTMGDWALTRGVNRIVFHRYQHQPWLDRVPGMTMGSIGAHWERTQTWWDMVHAYHKYLSRCQFMLQRGVPVVDVCFMAAEGAPHVFRPPDSAIRGHPPEPVEYNFDACAPETVINLMSVRNGHVVTTAGMTYQLLVLPALDTMTPALLRKIDRLVKGGATVIGQPPKSSPSLSGYSSCDSEVRALAEELWGADTNVQHGAIRKVGRGRVVWNTCPDTGISSAPKNHPMNEPRQYAGFGTVQHVLRELGVLPDFESDGPLSYTHRRYKDKDIYFLANREDREVTVRCLFRVPVQHTESWDPVTGTRRSLVADARVDHRTEVTLGFAPHQSRFVIFGEGNARAKTESRNSDERAALLELGGPWQVTFNVLRGAPLVATFESLQDWTERSEEEIRFHSGTAVYRKRFDISERGLSAEARFHLDLGTVKNIASVRLNGRDVGVAWCAPWRVDVSGVVRAAGNELEITVANLWPNRLIRDSGLPEGERVTWTTWNPYKADDALLPSGLLGPVTLRPGGD
jgi:hypothetical protein